MKTIAVQFPCTREQKHRLIQAASDYAEILFLQDMKTESERKQTILTAHIIIGEPSMEEVWANPNLEWLQITWAGTDKYTSPRPGTKGFPENVVLTNMSGAFGTVISEYAIGAILSLYRRFPVYWRQQQEEIWQDAGSEDILYGKTVLLLGTGDIGSSLAVRLKAFGTYNIGIRRDVSKSSKGIDEIHNFDWLDELLPKADIVACSLPDKPQTRGLLNEARLLRMKQDALLLNVGRGSLIDTDALVEVLRVGHLRGVILDVTSPEPLPKDHPLWKMDRVMLTPHIAGPSAGHSKDTQNRIISICCENIRRYFTGENLLNRIEEKG